jgi:hypothetical protein
MNTFFLLLSFFYFIPSKLSIEFPVFFSYFLSARATHQRLLFLSSSSSSLPSYSTCAFAIAAPLVR